MKDQDKRYKVVFLILAVVGVLSLGLVLKGFKQSDTFQIKNFPRVIGGWTSEEIPISAKDLTILETDNAFVRKYKGKNGQEVYLYIVYSQTNRKVSHPPEICYTGGGIDILEKGVDIIFVKHMNLSIQVNKLLLRAPHFNQISYYWFKEGDIFTASYWKQQMVVAVNTFLGRRKGSALIRISADIIHDDKQKAVENIKEFTSLIAPQLFQYLP